MTAKDYRLISSAVATAYKHLEEMRFDHGARHGVTAVAYALMRALKDTNARFDSDRFLKACGVPDNQ